jgi:hypothetical protein
LLLYFPPPFKTAHYMGSCFITWGVILRNLFLLLYVFFVDGFQVALIFIQVGILR